MVTKCCICGKIKIDGKWVLVNEPEGEEVSHSFCKKCFYPWLEKQNLSPEAKERIRARLEE